MLESRRLHDILLRVNQATIAFESMKLTSFEKITHQKEITAQRDVESISSRSSYGGGQVKSTLDPHSFCLLINVIHLYSEHPLIRN